MSKPKVLDIKINRSAIGDLCLKSSEIDSILMALGHNMGNKYSGESKVKLIKNIGKRHRVRIETSYKEASTDNKLLKAMKS